MFASAGADRRVYLWELGLINKSQTEEEELEGPPELMFIHGGHTDKVADFCWSQTESWMMASVAENNVLHIWKMGDHCNHLAQKDDQGDHIPYANSLYPNPVRDEE